MEITRHGETLQFLAERAVYWPRRRTVLVADLHLGKDHVFRRAGIPVPQGTTAEILHRLGHVIATTGAERLLILGDFWHAPSGLDPRLSDALQAWRSQHQTLDWRLVPGNHDRRIQDAAQQWRLPLTDPVWQEPPFCWTHDPTAVTTEEAAGNYVIGGHLHPAVRLRASGYPQEKLPCFWFGPRYGVLPAFNRFTGAHLQRIEEQVIVGVIADDEVIPWNPVVSSKANSAH